MTIGEKLTEHFPFNSVDGVFAFLYHVESNGKILTKRFKGRLDHEFVTAENGSDYSTKKLSRYNFSIFKAIPLDKYETSEPYSHKSSTEWVFESMLLGVSVHQSRMLSPIHINVERNDSKIRIIGKVLLELPALEKLNYTETI